MTSKNVLTQGPDLDFDSIVVGLRTELEEQDAAIAAMSTVIEREQADNDRLQAECDRLQEELVRAQQSEKAAHDIKSAEKMILLTEIERRCEIQAELGAAKAEIVTLRDALKEVQDNDRSDCDSEECQWAKNQDVLDKTAADYAHLTVVDRDRLMELEELDLARLST